VLLRERLHGGTLHIDRLQRLGVFRFQRTREPSNAATNFRFQLGFR
jgi:hypothetical protein